MLPAGADNWANTLRLPGTVPLPTTPPHRSEAMIRLAMIDLTNRRLTRGITLPARRTPARTVLRGKCQPLSKKRKSPDPSTASANSANSAKSMSAMLRSAETSGDHWTGSLNVRPGSYEVPGQKRVIRTLHRLLEQSTVRSIEKPLAREGWSVSRRGTPVGLLRVDVSRRKFRHDSRIMRKVLTSFAGSLPSRLLDVSILARYHEHARVAPLAQQHAHEPRPAPPSKPQGACRRCLCHGPINASSVVVRRRPSRSESLDALYGQSTVCR